MNMSVDVDYVMVSGQRWERVYRRELPDIHMVEFGFLNPSINKSIQFRVEPAKLTGKEIGNVLSSAILDLLNREQL